MNLPPPETIEVAGPLPDLDARLENVADRPAVFLIRPVEGAPYLGRTNLLRRRLKRLLKQREQPSRWLNLRAVASRVEYWPTASRLEASLVFYALARHHYPDNYLAVLKLRMPPYLKLILSNPFPRTQISTRLGAGRALYYGPFRTRAAAELFETEALDLFQIRRCQEDLAPSPAHPGCIYGEMGMCLRPCQQAVSREEYQSEVDRFAAFLDTHGKSLADAAGAARDRLSEEMNFEEAARQHKRLEKIQLVMRLRDDLVDDIERLAGIAVTASTHAQSVELWLFSGGQWQSPRRVGFDVVEGKTVSLDRRLREALADLQPAKASAAEKQEHLALLARWYYSSWRDGEWIRLDKSGQVPYRKLVRAVSHVAAASVTAPAALH